MKKTLTILLIVAVLVFLSGCVKEGETREEKTYQVKHWQLDKGIYTVQYYDGDEIKTINSDGEIFIVKQTTDTEERLIITKVWSDTIYKTYTLYIK